MINDTKCSPSCNSASESDSSHIVKTLASDATERIASTPTISASGNNPLAARIALAIDPTASPVTHDWHVFEIRHALRVRLYELERDAAILKSRLRAGHG